jgi:hypothetical protein
MLTNLIVFIVAVVIAVGCGIATIYVIVKR